MTAHSDPARPRPLRVVGADRYPSWEAVYRDNATWVYRTIFARVGNRADAEDLTAEVFLAALRPLRLTASVGEVRAYLRATARTVLAAHWRSTLGREVTSIEDIEAPPEREDAVSTAPQRVADLLDALPGQYRRILELRFLQSRSIRESAAELGVSVANAKVLQHRALRLAAQVNDGDEPLARRANDGDEPLARRANDGDEPLARRANDGDEPLARRANDKDNP